METGNTWAGYSGLRQLLQSAEPVFAPLVLNPLMARLAAEAGFRALYLGGGSMGYQICFSEANLTSTEMIHAGLDIRAACPLPLILDAACGWGDPMHMHRTIALTEAAGFAAIEIEDQILPKRAHHHVGLEHIIPLELMVSKIEQAVAARRGSEPMIIARTNAVRTDNLDEALRRGEAFAKAGADILFILARQPEQVRAIGERLPAPLMFMTPTGGMAAAGIAASELARIGYRLIVDATTPFYVMNRALRDCYAALAASRPDPLLGEDGPAEQDRVHETIGLRRMLDVERSTVER